ncbi:RNA-guided endonuclease InsQ/TnpB family protein [Streptomyces sp. NPDC050145]|uniref:RNA-guided endonuclease InsQ/TnpB family protein n=1 Tax=Streptomyces sp. NPDC050145 TaxID=3365602 RepID=UPI00378BB35F
MGEAVEEPRAVRGEAAARIKRDALGIGDRRKHHARKAKPLQSHALAPEARHRVYRYRCYPTAEQAAQLAKTFGACRWVYNEGLALREKAWREYRVSVGFAETCRALTGWRQAAETSWLRDVSSTVLQQPLRHLQAAFQGFFKGSTKYPKRKKKGRSPDSATYMRTGFSWREDPEQPGTGAVKLAMQNAPLDVRWSRPMPAGVTPVRLTMSRDRAGRFFVSFLVEEVIRPLPAVFVESSQEPQAVGLDLGLASLVTFDDGSKVDHPRLLRRYGARLKRLQQELHRKTLGSRNREKVRQKIARLYALIGDVRRDMLDQLTTRLVRENQVLVVEDLSVASLMAAGKGTGRKRKARLNESIGDASWGELLRMLTYKCEWYGRTLVVVDRYFPSTRRCSACHVVGPKLDVSVREWTCAECGVRHDRDANAAVNLRDEGMRLYWQTQMSLPPGSKTPALIKASDMSERVRLVA